MWFPSIVSALRRSSNQYRRSSLLTNHRQSRCRSVGFRFLTKCRGYAGLGEKTRWDQIKGQEGPSFTLEPKGDVCLKEQLAPGEVNGRLTNIEKKSPGAWEQMAQRRRPIGCGLDCDERTTSPIWI